MNFHSSGSEGDDSSCGRNFQDQIEGGGYLRILQFVSFLILGVIVVNSQ